MKRALVPFLAAMLLAAAPAGAKQGPCSQYAGDAYGSCNAWVANDCCSGNSHRISCANHLAHFQAAQCTGGQVACPACPALACADLLSDANNCGACGNVCGGGVCTNGVCGQPACNSSGAAHFTDDFSRADGALGPSYLTGLPLPNATIVSQQACGLDHDAAMVQIKQPSQSLTIDYDFSGATSGMETLAAVANLCTGDFVFAGQNAGTTLQIGDFNGNKFQSAQFSIQPNTVYHMHATFNVSGAVSVELRQGAVVIATLSANLGRPLVLHQAGAITGRNVNEGLNCIDNLSIQGN